MEALESLVRNLLQSSFQKSPEAMLAEALDMLIQLSGASGGSILGEEGAGLQFLFSDVSDLIGVSVPWDSIAGETVRNGTIIYTYAPKDKRHFDGIDAKIARSTQYLLSIPIPSVHSGSDESANMKSAGALQLLFAQHVFPAFDISSGPREFKVDTLREQDIYQEGLREVLWILPNIAFGLEVMKLRQTSYQAIHELKNKLISASSWLNCMKEDIETINEGLFEDEDVAEGFELAQSSVLSGARLAKSYLQFTKIYTPHFEEYNINRILQETGAAVQAFADSQSAIPFKVTLALDDSIPAAQLDPSQLQMAFFNLGKNAAEALIEHQVPAPEIIFVSSLQDDHCIVKIQDNGPGMPPEIASHLFVAFKTKKEGGTGLGLTITKKILDIHGATVECRTGSDGTCFSICF